MKAKITKTDTKEHVVENMDRYLLNRGVGIEISETLGQRELLQSEQLPNKINSPWRQVSDLTPAQVYEKMGIVVKGETKGDKMFLDVLMPDGWIKTGTGHAMWSNLLDNTGRLRGTIFYKAAFYDREAFINIEQKIKIVINRGKYLSREDKKANVPVLFQVIEQGAGVIYSTDAQVCPQPLPKKLNKEWNLLSDKEKQEYWAWEEQYDLWVAGRECEVIEWLKANKPDFENVFAYWD